MSGRQATYDTGYPKRSDRRRRRRRDGHDGLGDTDARRRTPTPPRRAPPGAVSGNTVQLPVRIPVNACGNTMDVMGLLNPAAGNTCVNEGADERGGDEGAHGSSGGAAADGSTQGAGRRPPYARASCGRDAVLSSGAGTPVLSCRARGIRHRTPIPGPAA
ncbi:chaplin [Streptomyces sp. KMM 9044]|uniref:chaplin n=1 Tax=Streptomyces sp. KMM 9044 TaxID=2744474 RepID=UPI002170E146